MCVYFNSFSQILVRQLHSKTTMSQNSFLPFFASGVVSKGFGRGSKELGIPTANFDSESLARIPAEVENGVYYGWTQVDSGPVYKMVMCLGWNPYYKNKEKSMEIHIMHKFSNSFYGSPIRVCVLKYLRPQTDFKSLDELITAINNDITVADKELESEDLAAFQTDPFFSGTTNGNHA